MAPPVTPSPHRFLLGKDKARSDQAAKIRPAQFRKRPSFHFTQSTSRERAESPSSTVVDEEELHDDRAPRNDPLAQTEAADRQTENFTSSSLVAPVQDTDLIVSFGPSDDDDGEGRNRPPITDANELTFRSSPGQAEFKEGAEDGLSPSTKRMRFSTQRQTPTRSPDQTRGTWSAFTQTSHKFLNSLTRENAQAEDIDTGISRRQAFMRPPSPQADRVDIEPHLLQFSPHRKGKTYEPGGLAATMQSHLMDMTSSGSFALPDTEQRPWFFTVTARENSIPFVLATGRTVDDQSGRFILPGSRVVPAVGDVVQVQGMTWTCELDDRPWLVCVDWRVVR